MEVYTALLDQPGVWASDVLGVFSTNGKARDACQEDYDEDNKASGIVSQLEWDGGTARLPDGSSYVVLMSYLDCRLYGKGE